MTLMTEREPSECDELLKADVLGRVRVRPEHRERMLDAFESSWMSGQAFAIHYGIKVHIPRDRNAEDSLTVMIVAGRSAACAGRDGWRGGLRSVSVLHQKAGQVNLSGFGENLGPHHCGPDEY